MLLTFSAHSTETLVYEMSMDGGKKNALENLMEGNIKNDISKFFVNSNNYKISFIINSKSKKGIEFYYLESKVIDKDGKELLNSEKKVSLYDKDTGRLAKTKIIAPKSEGGLIRYQADVRQGIDDWTNKKINEVYSKNYSLKGISSDKNGKYIENVNQLMSDDIVLDTYGFLLYLYKYKNDDKEQYFYYVDKGFIRKVKLTINPTKIEDGKSCMPYSVTYNDTLEIMSLCIDKETRKPIKVKVNDLTLTLSS